MFNILKQTFLKSLSFKSVFNAGFSQFRAVNSLSTKDLCTPTVMTTLLAKNIPKKTKRSQLGLFHKKQPKSGNQTCFSEKNDILDRDFEINVSTKAMKCIRKRGSFDNYILLTKPENLDSLYGEYLRKLMLTKLNNPDFRVPYIVRSKAINTKHSRKNYKLRPKPFAKHPPDQRYTDLSHLKLKTPIEMNRKELAEFKELEELEKLHEDVQVNHPALVRMQEEERMEKEILEKDRKYVLEKLEKKRSKVYKEKIKEIALEGIEELQLLTSKKPQPIRKPKSVSSD